MRLGSVLYCKDNLCMEKYDVSVNRYINLRYTCEFLKMKRKLSGLMVKIGTLIYFTIFGGIHTISYSSFSWV